MEELISIIDDIDNALIDEAFPNVDDIYLHRVLEKMWYTVRTNVAWSITQYDSKEVFIWQIAATARLLYETVAVLGYITRVENPAGVAADALTAYQEAKAASEVYNMFGE